MTDPDRFERMRRRVCALAMLVLAASCYYSVRTRYDPEECLILLLVLTVSVVVVDSFLGMLFPLPARRRVALRWTLLLVGAVFSGAYLISSYTPIYWVSGYPGNIVVFDLSHGELFWEVDRSNATEHDLSHGAPGRTRDRIELWPILLFTIPLTFTTWYDVIARKLPWLTQRYPPSHCQICGYNLTGNVSGICPECGEPCEPDASAT